MGISGRLVLISSTNSLETFGIVKFICVLFKILQFTQCMGWSGASCTRQLENFPLQRRFQSLYHAKLLQSFHNSTYVRNFVSENRTFIYTFINQKKHHSKKTQNAEKWIIGIYRIKQNQNDIVIPSPSRINPFKCVSYFEGFRIRNYGAWFVAYLLPLVLFMLKLHIFPSPPPKNKNKLEYPENFMLLYVFILIYLRDLGCTKLHKITKWIFNIRFQVNFISQSLTIFNNYAWQRNAEKSVQEMLRDLNGY